MPKWLVLAGCAALICAWTIPAHADAFRDAVDTSNRTFAVALLKGDIATIGELYTADAKVISPGAQIASGRAAIVAFWKAVSDAGVKDLVLKTDSTGADTDLGYEDGTVTVVDATGKATTSRYVVVWKREGGTWKLHRDIWN
jgi:ketosteroid isomerase-like protein